MHRITPKNLPALLDQHIDDTDFVLVLNALVCFLRRGGRKNASARFDRFIEVLQRDKALCRRFGNRFHAWLAEVHTVPALVKLGIFSRDSFLRETAVRIYERFSPSYKDFGNLREVFLYLFHSGNDEKWLGGISLRQWLKCYRLICRNTEPALVQTASRHIGEARLRAMELLSVWIAAEALEPELIRLEPRILETDSAFIALQREVSKLVEHSREHDHPYDAAHLEVMFDQCQTQVDHLRRRGTGAGSGSSVKVAHLLERLQQTLGRLKILIRIQNRPAQRRRFSITLLGGMVDAAVKQHSTRELRKSSIKMLARSITENKSHHGGHYITRTRKEYWNMLYSAAGGGVVIALMALHKIHIGALGYSEFATSLLAGLNYGFGFMLIHVLHMTVATKQPAMTAASFAEQVDLNERGRAVDNKLAKLLIDVSRSQSVAVFGNVSLAILVAGIVSAAYAHTFHAPLLSAADSAYQLESVELLTRPTLWYAAIAGVWLFCSGIIAGFFDNRADYLDLRNRLTVNPLLRKILPTKIRRVFAAYIHAHYGSLAGNFIFGMLLGMTGWLGHALGLPLDIRHVAFSSANLGYAAVSSHIGFTAFLYGMAGVLAIGLVNLIVSFHLALYVALRSRGTEIGSIGKLLKSLWVQIRANPLLLVYPVQTTGKNSSVK
ncbi:site-specific recombinase [Neisseria chenwenguii]|uniref:site-specific recombinase n=1 Tax=Neisseria chenwenguii TaxID=1853278 RepID=UPI000F505590|nr:recombinase [Neisseria chenwenguii]ROV55442.1 recombinase [Neisseria chenwenguii]